MLYVIDDRILPGGLDAWVQVHDDCVRWTVDFDSTIHFVQPVEPIVESEALFSTNDVLLQRNTDVPLQARYRNVKSKRFQYEERRWEPRLDPPKWTERSWASFEVVDLILPLPEREERCAGQEKGEDEFPEISMGYTPEAGGGFLAAFTIAFHRHEFVQDPQLWPLVGTFIAHGFERGPPGVFARKQYSRSIRWGAGTKQEETEIRIRHTPKERKLRLQYERQ